MFPIPNPPPSPYHPSGSSQCTSPKHPVSCIEPGLVTRFIYNIIYASMPFSQIIPPSLRKAFLSILAILWNSAFKWVYLSFSPLLFTSLFFSAICKASSDSYFAFFAFLFPGNGLDPCLLYNVMNLCP